MTVIARLAPGGDTHCEGSKGWQWTVPLGEYDRFPTLRDGEAVALEEDVRIGHRGRSLAYRRVGELQRLIRPIDDICSINNTSLENATVASSFLLRRMHELQMTYWAWPETEWVALLCDNQQTFLRLRSKSESIRLPLVLAAYLLGGVSDLHKFGTFCQRSFANKVFGSTAVTEAINRVSDSMRRWGYKPGTVMKLTPQAVCEVLLANRSPILEDLSNDVLEQVRAGNIAPYMKSAFIPLSRVLVDMGIEQQPLAQQAHGNAVQADLELSQAAVHQVSPEWLEWSRRWLNTSTLSHKTKRSYYCGILRAGRWLAHHHPEVCSPGQWTRQLAAEYIAAVDQIVIGQYAEVHLSIIKGRVGQPMSAVSKARLIEEIRTFFHDCQSWGWISLPFSPQRSFATPPSIKALIGPAPRVIADDIWAKLLWAGLNLTEDDPPKTRFRRGGHGRVPHYPFEMVRAMTMVWLFCGIRSDEFSRLRVGCIRWQHEDSLITGSTEEAPKHTVCLLDIPVNKTNTAFTKPVDLVVGEAIEEWEKVRPHQPAAIDAKTGESVQFLFSYRGQRVSRTYINKSLIPMLCRKVGIEQHDVRGDITSHRARSTIATQLFNAKDPLTLFELQEWLGHRSPATTQRYARITPTRLAKSYEKAGYFGRNLRTIDVLIDRDAISSGAAANGEPWRYYDLGHGYCCYEFFDQCPHRMACAKCVFYRPKVSSTEQIIEGKANLIRMRQDIPLSDDERAAVEDGITAFESLSKQLADVPTPAGPTPRRLGTVGKRTLPMFKSAADTP